MKLCIQKNNFHDCSMQNSNNNLFFFCVKGIYLHKTICFEKYKNWERVSPLKSEDKYVTDYTSKQYENNCKFFESFTVFTIFYF